MHSRDHRTQDYFMSAAVVVEVFVTSDRVGGVHLHAQTNGAVGRIPEGDVASISTSGGRKPWHDEKKDIHRQRESNSRIPDSEFGPLNAESHPTPAYQKQTEGGNEQEDVRGIALQVDDEVEGITGGRGEDHE